MTTSHKLPFSGLLIFRGKKSKISQDFQGQIREKSADFAGFSRGKSQNSRHIWPISGDFVGEKSKFAEKSAHFAGF